MSRPVLLGAGIATLITNSALFAFIRSKRNLRLLSHILLQSMLINGFIWGLYQVIRFSNNFSYTIGIICIVLPRLGQAIFISLNLHSCLIMSERYFAIAYPFRYNRLLTIGNLSIAVALVWLLPTAVPLVSIIDGIYSNRLTNCSVANIQQFLRIDFICHLIMLILATLLLTLLLAMYNRIIYLLKLSQLHQVGVATHGYSLSSGEMVDNSVPRSSLALRKKAVIQAMVVFTFYVIFLLPFQILSTITLSDFSYFRFLVPSVLVVRDIAFCYPALQPLVYAYFTADIRKEICAVYYKIVKSTRLQGRTSKNKTRVSTFKGASDMHLPIMTSNN
ncbi:Trace amine-associated receptor 8b [Trichoplax sp. H2]|nr:Trace amine-associated receptor 8b [Trichoplax sp. H2]|eukprot:RDD44863.1 Trace amine-associated receptor 8b [Trichoplax sp. H2]